MKTSFKEDPIPDSIRIFNNTGSRAQFKYWYDPTYPDQYQVTPYVDQDSGYIDIAPYPKMVGWGDSTLWVIVRTEDDYIFEPL